MNISLFWFSERMYEYKHQQYNAQFNLFSLMITYVLQVI